MTGSARAMRRGLRDDFFMAEVALESIGDQQDQQAQGGMDEDVDYHPGAGADTSAAAPNLYQDPNFVPPPVMATDGSGPSRQAPPFPPPYGT